MEFGSAVCSTPIRRPEGWNGSWQGRNEDGSWDASFWRRQYGLSVLNACVFNGVQYGVLVLSGECSVKLWLSAGIACYQAMAGVGGG